MIRATKVGLPGLLAAAVLVAAGQSAWADGFLSAGPVGLGVGQFMAAGPVAAGNGGFSEDAVADGTLSGQRAGDNINTNSLNNTINATTTQQTSATITGNTVNGDAKAGDVNFDKAALDGIKGIGQVVANSAPLGAAQGNIILNVFLNPGAAAP